MDNFQLVLFVFVPFGVWVSYRDWRDRKVSNGAIAGGLALGLWLCLLGGVSAWNLAVSAGFGLAVALGFWYAKLWPAGDAKLYTALSIVTAPLVPAQPYPLLRFHFNCLLNIFIPAAVCVAPLFFAAIWRKTRWTEGFGAILGDWKRGIFPTGGGNSVGEVVWSLGYIVFMVCLGSIFYQWGVAHLGGDYPLAIFLVFWLLAKTIRGLLWSAPHRGWKASVASLVVLYLMRRLGESGVSAVPVADMLNAAIKGLIVVIFLSSLDYQMDRLEAVPIPVGSVLPRSLISDSFWRRLRKDRDFDEKTFGKIYPDGLSEEQASLLRKWCSRRKIGTVEVYRAYPFALWIFLGFLVTIFTRANVVSLFRRNW